MTPFCWLALCLGTGSGFGKAQAPRPLRPTLLIVAASRPLPDLEKEGLRLLSSEARIREFAEKSRSLVLRNEDSTMLLDEGLVGQRRRMDVMAVLEAIQGKPLPAVLRLSELPKEQAAALRNLLQTGPFGSTATDALLSRENFSVTITPSVTGHVIGEGKKLQFGIDPVQFKVDPENARATLPDPKELTASDAARVPPPTAPDLSRVVFYTPALLAASERRHLILGLFDKIDELNESLVKQARERTKEEAGRGVRENGAFFGAWDGKTETDFGTLSSEAQQMIMSPFRRDFTRHGFKSVGEAEAFLHAGRIRPSRMNLMISFQVTNPKGRINMYRFPLNYP